MLKTRIFIVVNSSDMSFDIDSIIREEFKRFLQEDAAMQLQESLPAFLKKKHHAEDSEPRHEHPRKKHKKSDDGVRKNAIKTKGGHRKDYDIEQDKQTNPNLNNQDNKDIAKLLDNDYVNLAAVARDVYPDHTDQGAQSQLRKKVKGLKSDSGSTYKIKKREADEIFRSISKHLKNS